MYNDYTLTYKSLSPGETFTIESRNCTQLDSNKEWLRVEITYDILSSDGTSRFENHSSTGIIVFASSNKVTRFPHRDYKEKDNTTTLIVILVALLLSGFIVKYRRNKKVRVLISLLFGVSLMLFALVMWIGAMSKLIIFLIYPFVGLSTSLEITTALSTPFILLTLAILIGLFMWYRKTPWVLISLLVIVAIATFLLWVWSMPMLNWLPFYSTVAAEASQDFALNPLAPVNITQPDLDLHAYTSNGKHMGMNYTLGVYENQISGAIASGDK